MNCIGPPLSETPRVPRFLRQRLALQLLCRTGPAHRRSPSFTTHARSIPSGHQSRAMATFGLITCVSPSSAHTHPKLDSYQESYQAWRHAPGQPALKGFSYSHAVSTALNKINQFGVLFPFQCSHNFNKRPESHTYHISISHELLKKGMLGQHENSCTPDLSHQQ